MGFLTSWFGKWAVGKAFKSLPIKYIIYLIILCLFVANFVYIDQLRKQHSASKDLITAQAAKIAADKLTIESKDLVITQLKSDFENNKKINDLSNTQTAIVNTITKKVKAKNKLIIDKLNVSVSKIVDDDKIKLEDKSNLISIARIDALYEAYASGQIELITLKE